MFLENSLHPRTIFSQKVYENLISIPKYWMKLFKNIFGTLKLSNSKHFSCNDIQSNQFGSCLREQILRSELVSGRPDACHRAGAGCCCWRGHHPDARLPLGGGPPDGPQRAAVGTGARGQAVHAPFYFICWMPGGGMQIAGMGLPGPFGAGGRIHSEGERSG